MARGPAAPTLLHWLFVLGGICLVLLLLRYGREGARTPNAPEPRAATQLRVEVSDGNGTPPHSGVRIEVYPAGQREAAAAAADETPAILTLPAGRYDIAAFPADARREAGIWQEDVALAGGAAGLELALEPGRLHVEPLLAPKHPFRGRHTVQAYRSAGGKTSETPDAQVQGGQPLSLPPGTYRIKIVCRTKSGFLGAEESGIVIPSGQTKRLQVDLDAGAVELLPCLAPGVPLTAEAAKSIQIFHAADAALRKPLGKGTLTADPIYMPAGTYTFRVTCKLSGQVFRTTMRDIQVKAGETTRAEAPFDLGCVRVTGHLEPEQPLPPNPGIQLRVHALADTDLRRAVVTVKAHPATAYLNPGDYILRLVAPLSGLPLEGVLPQVTVTAGQTQDLTVPLKAGVVALRIFTEKGISYARQPRPQIEIFAADDAARETPLATTELTDGPLLLPEGDYALRVRVTDNGTTLQGVLPRLHVTAGRRLTKGVVVR